MRKRHGKFRTLFNLEGVGYSIPLALVLTYITIFILYSADREGLRLLFYLLLVYSTIKAIGAVSRQVKERYKTASEHPSVYHISIFWHLISLMLLSFGLLGAGVNQIFPETPKVPEAFIVAQVAASVVALSITNLILDYGGRNGQIGAPADPGPLRIFRSWRWPRQ